MLYTLYRYCEICNSDSALRTPRYRDRYNDLLRAGRSGDHTLVGERLSTTVQTDPGAHTNCCTVRTGSLPLS
jgi:hypothetical protein